MYPCPAKIPVVYEPDPTLGIDVRNAPKDAKPNAKQVMQTVLVPTAAVIPVPARSCMAQALLSMALTLPEAFGSALS